MVTIMENGSVAYNQVEAEAEAEAGEWLGLPALRAEARGRLGRSTVRSLGTNGDCPVRKYHATN